MAEEMGIYTIGFSDHLWQNPDITPSDWYRPQDEQRIVQLRHELSLAPSNLRVLVGCEADTISPGQFSITRDFAQSLDFTLLSCNHFHLKDLVQQPPSHNPKEIAAHMMSFFLSGVRSGIATVIAHPFVPYGYINQFDAIMSELSDTELFDAFCEARELGVGIEITAAYLPSRLLSRVIEENPSLENSVPSTETPIRLLSLAKQAGCKFSFGSDAHGPADQKELPQIIDLVKSVDVSRDDLVPLVLMGAEGNSGQSGS
ncbi:MAG: hypothetical protein ABSG01_03700 [Anaerolineales bacterium]